MRRRSWTDWYLQKQVYYKNSEQTEKCLKITSLCQKNCTVRLHPRLNVSVGLVYLRSFDIRDMDAFRDYLNEQDNENRVEKVERADFIKTGEGTSAYLITFNKERLPYTIYVPGEPADTIVRDFKSKPMLCRKCLTYGHSTGKCKKNRSPCARDAQKKATIEMNANQKRSSANTAAKKTTIWLEPKNAQYKWKNRK